MISIGRVVRRALSLPAVESRRGIVSCASSTASSFRAQIDSFHSNSTLSNSPFGICGQKRGLKGLCKFKAKSAGRNSSGRITIFHRGGGAKRLQRRIDLKRSVASMGVVERVEYDPNRSAHIALVRWSGDVQLPRQRKRDEVDKFTVPRKTVDVSTTTVRGIFSYCMLPGIRKVDAYQQEKTYPKEVFFSAFSARNGSRETPPLPLPRIAIAGANPSFIALRAIKQIGSKDDSSLCEVRKCVPSDSVLWAHRIQPKAALSWNSSRTRETLGMVAARKTAVKKPVYHKVDGK